MVADHSTCAVLKRLRRPSYALACDVDGRASTVVLTDFAAFTRASAQSAADGHEAAKRGIQGHRMSAMSRHLDNASGDSRLAAKERAGRLAKAERQRGHRATTRRERRSRGIRLVWPNEAKCVHASRLSESPSSISRLPHRPEALAGRSEEPHAEWRGAHRLPSTSQPVGHRPSTRSIHAKHLDLALSNQSCAVAIGEHRTVPNLRRLSGPALIST